MPTTCWLESHSPEPDVSIQLPRCPGLVLPRDHCIVPEAPFLRAVGVVVEHDLLALLQLLPSDDFSGSGPDVLGTHLDHTVFRVTGRKTPHSDPRATPHHFPSKKREARRRPHTTEVWVISSQKQVNSPLQVSKIPRCRRQVSITEVLWIDLASPKKICWRTNPWHLGMAPNLEIGSLQM